jgi:hypothetical protein
MASDEDESGGNDDPLRAAVDRRLLQLAGAQPTPPQWFRAWYHLGPASPDEERLSVYQAIRAAGSLPEEAGFFLVSWMADALTLAQAEEMLEEQHAQLEAVRQRHGLGPGEVFAPSTAPPDYLEAELKLQQGWDELFAATLEACGEADMARLFRRDRARFERIGEAGREYFEAGTPEFDPDEPAWLGHLREHVAECIETDQPIGSPELHYSKTETHWEILLYPMAADPSIGFQLDIEKLRGAFETVAGAGWDNRGPNDAGGSSFFIRGVFRGNEVFLRVLAGVPPKEEGQ